MTDNKPTNEEQLPVVRSQDKSEEVSIYAAYWNQVADDLTTEEG